MNRCLPITILKAIPMISHEHKCIFIHIPKCAGTSIEAALGHLDEHQGRGGQDHRSIRMIEPLSSSMGQLSNRENLLDLFRRVKHQLSPNVENPKNKYSVTQNQFDAYFKFTIVRNPWDRAFSWYRNYIRDSKHQIKGVSKSISFSTFLELEAGKGMLQPQTYWLKDFKGELPIDYIGRFENINDEFDVICKKLGTDISNLPHKIKGAGEDYRKHYDKESINIISNIYKDEIELFNYSFE